MTVPRKVSLASVARYVAGATLPQKARGGPSPPARPMQRTTSTVQALIPTRHPAMAKLAVVLIAAALAALPFALADVGTAWVRITNLAIL